ncbi:phage tail assembly chaperone [Porticoccaceae bacterium]|nr:phage tail assembly chaperone [Porticoccaceae bacterium]
MNIYVKTEKVNWGNKDTFEIEELDTVTAIVTTSGVVKDDDYWLAEKEPTPNSVKVGNNFAEKDDVFEPFIFETTKAEYARRRRNELLQETDWIANTSDHPQYSVYMTYRQELRDWPSTANFPDIRPELGV